MDAERPIAGGSPLSAFERCGCEVNRISPDELFQRYLQTKFVYPEKLRRLAPFTGEIVENWRRAAASRDELLRVVTYTGARARTWASLASWRHTTSAWCTQHLVSLGDPIASRAVLLAENQAMLDDPTHRSSQNWFRPENRLPRRVFGAIIPELDAASAGANTLTLFDVPLLPAEPGPGTLAEVSAQNQHTLQQLAAATRGPVYVAAEGIGAPDFELTSIDRLYRDVGLFRYRRAWIGSLAGEPVAALIAYRGPLGLNYSFIENRADLLVSPDCPEGALVSITRQLIAAASDTYRDFSPGHVPLFVEERTATALAAAGLRPIRRYCQTVYLRSCYARYLAHLERTFARVAARAERKKRALEAAAVAPALDAQ